MGICKLSLSSCFWLVVFPPGLVGQHLFLHLLPHMEQAGVWLDPCLPVHGYEGCKEQNSVASLVVRQQGGWVRTSLPHDMSTTSGQTCIPHPCTAIREVCSCFICHYPGVSIGSRVCDCSDTGLCLPHPHPTVRRTWRYVKTLLYLASSQANWYSIELHYFWHAVIFYLIRPLYRERLSRLLVMLALSLGGANLFFYYQVEFAARLYCPKKV